MNLAAESRHNVRASAWFNDQDAPDGVLTRPVRGEEECLLDISGATHLPGQTVFSISPRVSSESVLSRYLIPGIETLARTIDPSRSEEESLRRFLVSQLQGQNTGQTLFVITTDTGTLPALASSISSNIPLVGSSDRPRGQWWDESEIGWQPSEEASETIQSRVRIDVLVQFRRLFEGAEEFRFEDGVETEFSKELLRLVGIYGQDALPALTQLIVEEPVCAEVSSEALRWLGRMSDSGTHRARLWLLERSLNSLSPVIRDGAILGLASLGDRSVLRYLQIALNRENNKELRKDIEQVMNQFRSTQ